MSDNRDFAFSTDGWVEAQRTYWDAWASLTKQALEAGTPRTAGGHSATVWADGLEQWWKAVGAGSPPEARDFFARMVDQGKTFFHLGEEWTALLQGMAAEGRAAYDWQRGLAARFDELRAGLAQNSFGPDRSAKSWSGFWEAPFDAWLRLAGSVGAATGGAPGGSGGVHERLERMLSVPGVGYSREWQEEAQELARRSLVYQRALAAYGQVFARLGSQALDRLQAEIVARGEAGKPITTLRQLYDLWVDAAEGTYLELVRTDEYATIYGDLVNSLMAVKQQGREMLDGALGAVGMPTTRGLNTLLRRQQDLKRQLVALRRQSEDGSTAELRREVEALRAEVRALKPKRAGPRRAGGARKEKKK